MSAAQLILIEGMIGSGKTTTAMRVGDWLVSQGENARVFREGTADHPIRTRAEDRAGPLLVYLRPADIGAVIARIHRTRGEPWSSRNVTFVESSPWARRRGLRGQDAVVRLYQAWEPVAVRLYSRYPFPKIMVTDPQHDWQATLTRICAAVHVSAG